MKLVYYFLHKIQVVQLYSWVSDTQIGAGLSGTGDMDFTATIESNYRASSSYNYGYTLTFENGGIVCDGEDKTFTITVNPTVQVNQSLDQVVCNLDEVSGIIYTKYIRNFYI